MSNLSLSVDELSRLEEQAAESLSFGMQSRAPPPGVAPLDLGGMRKVFPTTRMLKL